MLSNNKNNNGSIMHFSFLDKWICMILDVALGICFGPGPSGWELAWRENTYFLVALSQKPSS